MNILEFIGLGFLVVLGGWVSFVLPIIAAQYIVKGDGLSGLAVGVFWGRIVLAIYVLALIIVQHALYYNT